MTIKDWQDKVGELENGKLADLHQGLVKVLEFGPIAEKFESLKVVLTIVDIEIKNRT